MSENPIKISITGKLTYSDEITISQAAKIIDYLNSGMPGLAADGSGESLDDSSTRDKNNTTKVTAPREALERSGAQKNPEKIVALAAYFLLDGPETFKPDDVKAVFRRARETAPANFTRDLGLAISAGWVVEDKDVPGEYFLTNKIDGIFDGGFTFPKGSAGAGRARASRKPGAKTEKPGTLADIDEFYNTLEGFPPYSKLKNEKDRLLWVTTYMREKHGRKGVTNKELAWISDYIGAGIPTNNIGGAFNMAKTPGFALRSTLDKTIKVTDEGVAHLAKLATES
jgi:hypothetical protein